MAPVFTPFYENRYNNYTNINLVRDRTNMSSLDSWFRVIKHSRLQIPTSRKKMSHQLLSSGEVNVDVIPRYAEYIKNKGIKGVLVNGTAGEGVSMTVEERKLVLEIWSQAAKVYDLKVMVQVGGRSVTDTIELAKHAEKRNVDAILCLPELFFKPKTHKELIEYLCLISDSAPNTPLFYYHIPAFTGVTLDMPTFLKDGSVAIKTLSGIKFTHNNLQEGAACLSINDDLTIFHGNEQTLAGACILGFHSCIIIGVNLLPKPVLELMENVENNRNADALELQKALSLFMEMISNYGLVPGAKRAMSIISEFELGQCRAPLPTIPSDEIVCLKDDLKKMNII